MIKDSVFAALELANERRAERRRFLKLAGAGAAAAGGLGLLSACGSDNNDDTPTPTPSPTPTATASGVATDVGILQLALNLEYLEAQFYSIAAFGRRLPDASLTGAVGTRGDVTGGRQVTFSDPVIASYAREIAGDEIAHVTALRAVLTAAGSTLVIAQPAINIDGGATGAFTAAARAAGLVDKTSGTFDPYESDQNFLLAAFLFEDVGVSAYKGASPLITSATYLEAAAGILAAEAYHAGLIRTELFARGETARAAANAIAAARDSLDGSATLDAGIANSDGTANLVPADSNAIAYSRSSTQVHNIAYLRTTAGVGGGFFPAGTNNSIEALRTSGATA
ncbi:ferritin-like domain-containing protein [Sphingomonas yunnanensis]|uniref:ferritin-like domain-containing protein n=1 Tax=Sphingomonas yunnanensis TaxID=310400 RepID=UPI001CA69AFE|nr:ferritin-like domain-containing protein [Sphingomonas yunnanensis]MBY9065050.1 ferritin-like domain-containing protein [Sphingomonas yunnanensis]